MIDAGLFFDIGVVFVSAVFLTCILLLFVGIYWLAQAVIDAVNNAVTAAEQTRSLVVYRRWNSRYVKRIARMKTKPSAEYAASKALRNPKNSKAAKTARGSALNQR